MRKTVSLKPGRAILELQGGGVFTPAEPAGWPGRYPPCRSFAVRSSFSSRRNSCRTLSLSVLSSDLSFSFLVARSCFLICLGFPSLAIELAYYFLYSSRVLMSRAIPEALSNLKADKTLLLRLIRSAIRARSYERFGGLSIVFLVRPRAPLGVELFEQRSRDVLYHLYLVRCEVLPPYPGGGLVVELAFVFLLGYVLPGVLLHG